MRWVSFMTRFSPCECEHIYHLRGRHGAISIKKIKNNMLAAVLALTIVPLWVKVGKAVVEHGCFLISQKLLNVYTRCIPTYKLVPQSAKTNGTRTLVRRFWARIELTVLTGPYIFDPDKLSSFLHFAMLIQLCTPSQCSWSCKLTFGFLTFLTYNNLSRDS